MKHDDLSKTLKRLDYKSLHRLTNTTAIFITDIYDQSGGSFLRFLKLNRALPEHVLILSYTVMSVPYVACEKRFQLSILNDTICELTLHYGFMDTLSVPEALRAANAQGILPYKINIKTAIYMLEIPNVIATRKTKALWFFWQEKLFAFLVRIYSANLNIEFYQLPFDRTIAVGTYYPI